MKFTKWNQMNQKTISVKFISLNNFWFISDLNLGKPMKSWTSYLLNLECSCSKEVLYLNFWLDYCRLHSPKKMGLWQVDQSQKKKLSRVYSACILCLQIQKYVSWIIYLQEINRISYQNFQCLRHIIPIGLYIFLFTKISLPITST